MLLTIESCTSSLLRFLNAQSGGILVVKPLLIHVDHIEEANQPWQAVVPVESLDEVLGGDRPTEYRGDGPMTVMAKLTRMGRKVLFQARFDLALAGSCKRCLCAVKLAAPVELTLTYVHEAPAHGGVRKGSKAEAEPDRAHERADRDEEGSAGSFDPALADEESYSGNSIDVAPALREQILLSLPPAPLCKDDCQGLCQSCGQDLNLADCGHVADTTDPRWAALKKIQLSEPPGSPRTKE
jgi:uncharacterized protein